MLLRTGLLTVVMLIVLGTTPSTTTAEDTDGLSTSLVFPLHTQHNHAPGIVECPNGDLLVSWYRGSGERQADDVAVLGARRRKGESQWSEVFPMADHPEFPDCNTCMMIDSQERLWLFWPIIIANSWESCLTRFKVSSDYMGHGPPVWERQDTIFLKPDDFSEEAIGLLDEFIEERKGTLSPQHEKYFGSLKEELQDKLLQRLGWQPRCKPTVLPSGRILLPLYTDTYSFSLMAISDDQGDTWYASKPIMGFGSIQPAVLRKNDGTLVAYMRENGPINKIRVSESPDDGISWGPVGAIDLPNPGSGLDAVRLQNGHWAMIYNDTDSGRNSLAVSISDDEGQTWKWTRHLEKQESGSYHYPAIIQGKDGTIHAIYSYFVEGGKSMKHAEFREDWVHGK
ncbi:MAG: exo-alpha-sialidase [Planctomycetaceae bacterium]|nr:exo-alpha-sialidase [Planctomycetaceae bacterium]